MSTTPTRTAAPATINQQTPGPVLLDSSETLTAQTHPARWIATVKAHPNAAEQVATGRLLAASYTMADAAGRELDVDAADLCGALDLAALIRAAQGAVSLLEDLSNGGTDTEAAIKVLRAALPPVFPEPSAAKGASA